MVVLPVPGPPVMRMSWRATPARMAFCWPGVRGELRGGRV